MLDDFPAIKKIADLLSNLPGVGAKTALKYALWFVEHKKEAKELSLSLNNLHQNVRLCKKCRNITTNSDSICDICKSATRKHSVICVVESMENFLAIESSSIYNGVYYILGGLISPLYGIDSYNLGLDYLVSRIVSEKIKEVILVLSSTLEGDLTTQYIKESLKDTDTKITRIASGVPVGANINFVDKSTLVEAFKSRHIV